MKIAPQPRESKGAYLQPPLDPSRGFQHHHYTSREKRGHQEIGQRCRIFLSFH
jgi:hypothetical protein